MTHKPAATVAGTYRFTGLLHGLDGLFMTPDALESRYVPLVVSDSPHEAWARQLVPSSNLLTLHLRPSVLQSVANLTTDQLLLESDAGTRITRAGISSLLPSCSSSLALERWATARGIKLLAVPAENGSRLENKLSFSRLLKRASIPQPRSEILQQANFSSTSLEGALVLQVPDSTGGEGTFFFDNAADLRRFLREKQRRLKLPYLIRERIEGRAMGISILVAPQTIALSSVRLQCYWEEAGRRRVLAGIQWLKTSSLSLRLRKNIQEHAYRLGRVLQAQRFYGLMNVDFMVNDDDQVFVLECNPRMAASSPQLFKELELTGGHALGKALLAFWHSGAFETELPAFVPLPSSQYQGATLDLLPAHVGWPARACGVYRLLMGRLERVGASPKALSQEQPFLISWVAGQDDTLEPEATTATILSECPLYGERGEFNTMARSLLQALASPT